MRSQRRALWWNRWRGRAERGATVVEYALIVAVLGIPLIAVAAYVVTSGGDRFDATGSVEYGSEEAYAGTPDGVGGPSGGGVTTTSGPPPPTTSTTSGPGAPGENSHISAIALTDIGKYSAAANSKWFAEFTITVIDGSGNPVSGATISGSWTESGNPGTTSGCVTNASGQCSVRAEQIRHTAGTSTWSVTLISIPGGSYNPGADSPPSGSALKPA